MRNGTENQIRCYLVRHGLTPAGEEHRYLGRTDQELSEKGISDLRRRLAAGAYAPVELWAASPMRRCVQTAELLWPGTEGILIPDFREMDFGDWEGKNYRELSGDPVYQSWIDSGGELQIPGGESKAAFVGRILRGWEELLTKLRALGGGGPGVLGIAAHGGTVMALMSSLWGGAYYDYQVSGGDGFSFWLDVETGRMNEVTGIGT